MSGRSSHWAVGRFLLGLDVDPHPPHGLGGNVEPCANVQAVSVWLT